MSRRTREPPRRGSDVRTIEVVLIDPAALAELAEDGGASAEEQIAERETARMIEALRASVRPCDWRVLVGYAFEGRPIAEIASSEGIGESTARNRLRLARRDLAAAVRRLRARSMR